MNEYCMLETANDNYEEIKSIAKELLDKKLVASCHILESESSWNWNNAREEAKEYLLQMKTKKKCLKEIYEVIILQNFPTNYIMINSIFSKFISYIMIVAYNKTILNIFITKVFTFSNLYHFSSNCY